MLETESKYEIPTHSDEGTERNRNIYTNSLRAYTISSVSVAIFSKVENASPFFFTCSMSML